MTEPVGKAQRRSREDVQDVSREVTPADYDSRGHHGKDFTISSFEHIL